MKITASVVLLATLSQIALAQDSVDPTRTLVPIIGADATRFCSVRPAPEMPMAAIARGISGRIEATAHVQNGVVTEVNVTSGPSVFRQSVVAAMLQYKCQDTPPDHLVRQEFNFVNEKRSVPP